MTFLRLHWAAMYCHVFPAIGERCLATGSVVDLNVPQLMMTLHPNKLITDWIYHRLRVHLAHLSCEDDGLSTGHVVECGLFTLWAWGLLGIWLSLLFSINEECHTAYCQPRKKSKSKIQGMVFIECLFIWHHHKIRKMLRWTSTSWSPSVQLND